MDKRIESLTLWAWVGEDELGSGKIGLKQALVPAGMIPLAGVDLDKMAQPLIQAQLARQARSYGKAIRLVRFRFEAVELDELPAH